ncbi:MAG TPA: helix-turn-helix transcriptional regulator [Pilimelia sp.]|nr:helix-turn-helix transcriptional regulator [Pilimelia sp.]
MTARSPTILRRQLGAALREFRERAGLTVAAVAGDLGWSESKLSRIETAHIGIRRPDLERLLDHYAVAEPQRRRLLAMAGQARQRGWWEAYGEALPTAYETYIGLEAEATRLREYNATVVPGLLQTDEYAHAVIKMVADIPVDVAADRVSVRLARRAVLTREPPLELCLIVDEAALRRRIGGRDIMRRQLRALLEAVERPAVTLQVLPFAIGSHAALAGSFTILDFEPGLDTPTVYCDGMTGGVFRTAPGDVAYYAAAFTKLSARALAPTASQEFITECLREFQ